MGRTSGFSEDSIRASAKRFKTRSAWALGHGRSYAAAKKIGQEFFEQCCRHMQSNRRKWTPANILKVAKEFTKRSDWVRASPSSYVAAARLGILEDCCSHMPVVKNVAGYWTLERCKAEAKKYSTRKEWKRGSGPSNTAAYRNGWTEECCAHMNRMLQPKHYWTKQRCIEAAKKFNQRSKWRWSQKSSYSAAVRNGWLEDCCKHMKKRRGALRIVYRFVDYVANYAYVGLTCNPTDRFYRHLKDKPELTLSIQTCDLTFDHSDYVNENEAQKLEAQMMFFWKSRGFILLNKVAAGSLGSNGTRLWNRATCKAEAANYSTRTEWATRSGGSYQAALIRGWLDYCCKHMQAKRKSWTKQRVINSVRHYTSRLQWARENPYSYRPALGLVRRLVETRWSSGGATG
jgi:hypothetical protein